MADEKRPLKDLVGKMVVTKEGKRIGFIQDLTFETKTGELIQMVIKNPTPHAQNLNLERTNVGEILIPHNSIMAIGDFIVVSEEDLR
jgi:sporulation protein YlmC with PRC-barrel domain